MTTRIHAFGPNGELSPGAAAALAGLEPGGGGGTVTATDAPTAPAEGASASYLVTSAVVWPAGLVWSTDPDGGSEPTITDAALVSLFTVGGVTRAVLGATFPAVVIPDPEDETPPTPGTLAASAITSESFTLTVTGASDETALHSQPYAFSTDNGATWTAWQTSASRNMTGLDPETEYTCVHRVRDAASNIATGSSIPVETAAAAVGGYTDFSDYETDETPDDWTIRWGAPSSVEVVEEIGATGDAILRIDAGSTDARSLVSWDAADGLDDVEVLTRIRTDSLGAGNRNNLWVVLRGSGAPASESGYILSLRGKTCEISKYIGGVVTQLDSDSFVIAADTWYWVRFRAVGTTLQAKVWTGAIEDEPGTWQLQATDASLASGWCGIGWLQWEGPKSVDVFTYALGGDTADLP